MGPVLLIEDPTDPRLVEYVALTDVALRSRTELLGGDGYGVYVAEGELVLRRALSAGHRLRSVLLGTSRVAQLEGALAGQTAPVYTASDAVLEQVTGFHVHRGVLAVFARPAPRSPVEVLAGASRVLVLEEVNNHTNVGAVARTAAALGIDALLLCPRTADPLYRRAVRVSMGEVLALPWARLDPWPASLRLVRDAGFTTWAFTPAPDAVDAGTLAVPDKVAVLLGAEGTGLTAAAQAAADVRVRIPMAADVDSLNIAACAAVACWIVGKRPSDRLTPPPARSR